MVYMPFHVLSQYIKTPFIHSSQERASANQEHQGQTLTVEMESVAIVDANTLIAFLESPTALQDSVDKLFESIHAADGDGTGGSNSNHIRDRIIAKILPVETKSQEEAETLLSLIVERFGGDGSDEGIGREEFKALVTEIVLALARGIGDVPVIMALHPDSWLSMAVHYQQEQS